MRGDRPPLPPRARVFMRATPHARGSTCPAGVLRRGGAGYPACAGIDPKDDGYFGYAGRLPRMRGDRPLKGWYILIILLATPHARGSTHSCRSRRAETTGYPACAGIDPIGGKWSRRRWGLPRMRGDRPHHKPDHRQLYKATPHARGSTYRGFKVRTGS